MNEPQQHTMRRLGIIDLMVVTTAVAFVYILYGTSGSETAPLPTDWISRLYIFVAAITMGLVLPAIYWIPVHYARTGKILSQPGHWLLGTQFLLSIWSIGFFIASISIKTFVSDGVTSYYSIAYFVGVGFLLAATIIWIIAAIKLKEARWKIASVLLAVSFTTQGLARACHGIFWLDQLGFYSWPIVADILRIAVMLIAALGLIVTVLVDWKSKVSRDWLHWVGVISTLVLSTVMAPLQLLLTYFPVLENQ